MQEAESQATLDEDAPITPGLTSEEALRRLRQAGPNEPAPIKRVTTATEIISLFTNPLVIILLVASLISSLVGDLVNAAIIVAMVLLSSTLNFIQTSRSRRGVERLRTEIAPTATVLRDSSWIEIARRQIVPGDVVRLVAGDLVPADGRLLESRDLHVQEAALTGESLPVEKEPPIGDRIEQRNLVFLGTSVVSGLATALITATGQKTAFGDIARRLALRAPETEFERGLRQFGILIMRTVIFLVLFVFLVTAVFRHNPLESLLFALALAVGLTPEFLPMITTVTLGRGAVHMAREKVIVKHLAAIQNFGSIDILCSDKTGTLTSGEMSLDDHVDAFGNSSERVFLLAYLNSYYQTGIGNPIDAAIKQRQSVNPLDVAILHHDRLQVDDYRKVDEVPFSFERRRVTVTLEHGGGRVLITKGAPEAILPLCLAYERDGGVHSLDENTRSRCATTYQKLSKEGLRVLAVAWGSPTEDLARRSLDEPSFTLAGFLTFSDPPLDTAAVALRALRRDGVQVKILTGDSDLVAQHVCSQVGINVSRVVLGDEVDRTSDAALGHVAEQTAVFARVSPAQKNRIIFALKRRGHVVGFMGDGINDAPSLHTADVGISVSTATDVAKDAAEIILLERGLTVLHKGILEGRKAFGNVMKYLLMGTSSNFGNMFSMAAASVFLPFLPMLPTQILLNNFLYDLAQVTIPTDKVDATFIRKPHRWDMNLIRDFMVTIGPISSAYDFLTFFALLKIFEASETLFHTGWFVESLATQTLVIFIIRTAGKASHSRPSLALTITTVVVVLVGVALPFTPLARVLGFTPLPVPFLLFLAGVTVTYLAFVELAKRRLMRRLF
jgi:Mg2+-importing ATPase